MAGEHERRDEVQERGLKACVSRTELVEEGPGEFMLVQVLQARPGAVRAGSVTCRQKM